MQAGRRRWNAFCEGRNVEVSDCTCTGNMYGNITLLKVSAQSDQGIVLILSHGGVRDTMKHLRQSRSVGLVRSMLKCGCTA